MKEIRIFTTSRLEHPLSLLILPHKVESQEDDAHRHEGVTSEMHTEGDVVCWCVPAKEHLGSYLLLAIRFYVSGEMTPTNGVANSPGYECTCDYR